MGFPMKPNPAPRAAKAAALVRARQLANQRQAFKSDAAMARALNLSRQRVGQILRRVRDDHHG